MYEKYELLLFKAENWLLGVMGVAVSFVWRFQDASITNLKSRRISCSPFSLISISTNQERDLLFPPSNLPHDDGSRPSGLFPETALTYNRVPHNSLIKHP